MITMSELPLGELSGDAVREAARGRVIHITEGGQRIAAIVPESVLKALQAAEDAADAADADAAWDEPGEDVPWEQVKAELGL
jgi:antitoxin Phd